MTHFNSIIFVKFEAKGLGHLIPPPVFVVGEYSYLSLVIYFAVLELIHPKLN